MVDQELRDFQNWETNEDRKEAANRHAIIENDLHELTMFSNWLAKHCGITTVVTKGNDCAYLEDEQGGGCIMNGEEITGQPRECGEAYNALWVLYGNWIEAAQESRKWENAIV